MSDVKPLGGTELILANLQQALPELCSKVQIIMSRPEQVELEDKPRILWLQDLPQDPASSMLRDAGYRTRFNRIVFCSHWQQQQYNQYLGIPYSEGTVFKNAVPHREPVFPKPYGGKLKFIYTSTPHRGLAILGAAAELLAKERQDWELHVYSSLNIYGWHEQDKQFEPLYDILRKNPQIIYHGTQPNAVVRQALDEAHVFVYPSVYAETSCMAAQEALMAGCLVITSNYGALPETCAEWAWMFPYDERPEAMIINTVSRMREALDTYGSKHTEYTLRAQSNYYQQFYSFESRIPAWTSLLESVIKTGPPVEMMVIG
jgi:glycosyltransferase involved in cell wall biosynthesis